MIHFSTDTRLKRREEGVEARNVRKKVEKRQGAKLQKHKIVWGQEQEESNQKKKSIIL